MPNQQPFDFSVERFYGMHNSPENIQDAEIFGLASEFRNTIEHAWSKNTAYPPSNENAGRYSSEGQCAVTMHLFDDQLTSRWPGINARVVLGAVENTEGRPYTENHVWEEISTDDGRTLVVDLAPDQKDGLGKDAPKKIMGYAEDLAREGYVYTARKIDEPPEGNPSLAPRYEILRRRYEHVLENVDFYNRLASQNVFIVGGVASGKTGVAKSLEKAFPDLHTIDVGNLFRIATKAIIEEAQTSPLHIDVQLLERVQSSDQQAVDTFIGLLSRKTVLLQKVFSSVELSVENGTRRFEQNGTNIEDQLSTEQVENFVPLVAQAQNVRKAVWTWIDRYAGENGGVLLTGHSLVDIDTTQYAIVELAVTEAVAAQRLMGRSPDIYTTERDAASAVAERNRRDDLPVTSGILRYLGIESVDTVELSLNGVAFAALRKVVEQVQQTAQQAKLQKEISVPREKFTWEVNGLVSGIRTVGEKIFTSIVSEERQKDASYAPTEFDLSIQTIMQLCGYEPAEVWQGDQQLTEQIANMLHTGSLAKANQMLGEALQTGRLQLNEQLVRDVARGQVERLRSLNSARYNDEFALPDYSDPSLSPFANGNAEVSSKNKSIIVLPDGTRALQVRERQSGKTVALKQVDPAVSRAYATALHYLHAGRKDEYMAFGAFAEGEEFPFAWVSYSPVDRQYKKDMLHHFGVEPHRILEMTRAWNANWSPKNTMSLLFSFAHSEMQLQWQKDAELHLRDKPLAGIITAINPNLGFRANAFNGVDFGVVGLKPAGFTYLLDEAGRATYMPRRAIAKALGISEADLESHPRFMRNKLPLMPTNEMVVLFKGTSRYQIQEPIYRIPESDYKDLG